MSVDRGGGLGAHSFLHAVKHLCLIFVQLLCGSGHRFHNPCIACTQRLQLR